MIAASRLPTIHTLPPMYACTVRKDDQTRRFTITDAGASGWEVREEEDDHVRKQVVYSDWHRVERARMAFATEASQTGWIDAEVSR